MISKPDYTPKQPFYYNPYFVAITFFLTVLVAVLIALHFAELRAQERERVKAEKQVEINGEKEEPEKKEDK